MEECWRYASLVKRSEVPDWHGPLLLRPAASKLGRQNHAKATRGMTSEAPGPTLAPHARATTRLHAAVLSAR
jgi:hypothetical protein